MMKTSIVAVTLLTIAGIAPVMAQQYNYSYDQQAAPRYNPFNRNWEMTYPNSELRYNPFHNTWQYTAPNAELQYNPFNNRWEYPH